MGCFCIIVSVTDVERVCSGGRGEGGEGCLVSFAQHHPWTISWLPCFHSSLLLRASQHLDYFADLMQGHFLVLCALSVCPDSGSHLLLPDPFQDICPNKVSFSKGNFDSYLIITKLYEDSN